SNMGKIPPAPYVGMTRKKGKGSRNGVALSARVPDAVQRVAAHRRSGTPVTSAQERTESRLGARATPSLVRDTSGEYGRRNLLPVTRSWLNSISPRQAVAIVRPGIVHGGAGGDNAVRADRTSLAEHAALHAVDVANLGDARCLVELAEIVRQV